MFEKSFNFKYKLIYSTLHWNTHFPNTLNIEKILLKIFKGIFERCVTARVKGFLVKNL